MNQTPATQTPRRLPLTVLRESPTNPRTVFKGIEELADTIRSKGVFQALIVRPLPKPEKGITHEIVAGARRFRASKLAGTSDIPVDIRTLTDDEVDDIQQIENLQREDLGPLEEAQGFARMIAKPGQSVQTLATRLGKKPEYIAGRLSLLKLSKEPREALTDNRIGLPHALKIAALAEPLQKEALAACFAQSWNQTGLLPVAQLEKWIERNVLLSLKTVPFDIGSSALLSNAGSCEDCYKRTGANTLLFPGVAEDSCMDRKCLQAKIQAHVQALQEQRPELVRISTQSFPNGKDGTLGMDSFVIVQPKKNGKKPENQKCDHMRDALVVNGHDAGAQHIVCANPNCKVHRAHSAGPSKAEADHRAKMRAEEREKKLKTATRRAIADAILLKFKVPTLADWRAIVASAVRHVPHEYRIDLAKRYGCYPKTKQPGSLEMQHALEKHVESLDAPNCYRLLFDMAILPLVRSQYRDTADAELKALAKRFRLDAGAIAKQVRTAGTKPKKKTEAA